MGRSPDAVAVMFGGTGWSYAQLDAAANRLARELIGRGIGPEQVVALVVARSAEMVVVLLGMRKAGAAYLPVDPDYPEARIEFMLADADPAVVVTTSGDGGRGGA